MSYYEITGGRPLNGSLSIHGAKNSVLPILAACLLIPGECVIHNCPHLSDVAATLDILRLLGCQVQREGETVTVDASTLDRWDIPEHLMREMRSSVIFLGALLARLGRAELSYPGGCELGPRPIDLHLTALRGLGAEIKEEQGVLCCSGGSNLRGREIYLPIPSVGATENVMLAACGCEGVTTILGAAREPEIMDLQGFLQAAGAKVTGAGTARLTVEGRTPLHPARYHVMGDRIAAATYLCAAAAATGEVEVTDVAPDTLTAVLTCLEEAGCEIRTGQNQIALICQKPLTGIQPVRTAPYPGFPTDAQALLMAALAGGEGATLFVENIFDSRYRHVDELRRMGADIQIAGRAAMVSGVGKLHGAAVRSTDLRGGAALVVAALGAEGPSQVGELRHIKRGYQSLDRNLRALGAQIREIP